MMAADVSSVCRHYFLFLLCIVLFALYSIGKSCYDNMRKKITADLF